MLFQFSAIYTNVRVDLADHGRAHRPCLCPPQIPEFCLWFSHSARRSHPPASAHSSSQPGSGLGRPPPSSTPAHEAQRCGPWGTNHSHVTSVRRSTALTGAGGRLDWKATCPRPGALRVFVWGLHLQLGGFMIFVFFQKWWLGKQSTRAGVNLGSLHGAAGKEGWGCPKPSVPNTLRTRRYSPVEAAAKYDKPRC